MEKKRRGRRPKNNITVNENPVFENSQKIDNLIICLKNKQEDKPLENELPGYSKTDYEIEQDNEIKNTELVCWNCSHPFHKQLTKCIPIKYNNGVFYTYGTFCSFECGGRYLFDNYNGSELWEKISILNIFSNITLNKNDKLIIAPPKLNLQMFGGDLSIDEYRKHSSYLNYDINIPPIIPVHHTNYKYDAKIKNNDNQNDLKLYRKISVVNENNIFKTMNIQKEN